MNKNIYKERRESLSSLIPNNSAIIIPGADNRYRNADSAYAFRQESSFYYLSGFCEASSVMLLVNNNNICNWYLGLENLLKPLKKILRPMRQHDCEDNPSLSTFPG